MKIPKEAKKIFSGVMFNVYQWKQEMFDGSNQTFEMIARAPSTDVITLVDDKIMVLMQEQPTKPYSHHCLAGELKAEATP